MKYFIVAALLGLTTARRDGGSRSTTRTRTTVIRRPTYTDENSPAIVDSKPYTWDDAQNDAMDAERDAERWVTDTKRDVGRWMEQAKRDAAIWRREAERTMNDAYTEGERWGNEVSIKAERALGDAQRFLESERQRKMACAEKCGNDWKCKLQCAMAEIQEDLVELGAAEDAYANIQRKLRDAQRDAQAQYDAAQRALNSKEAQDAMNDAVNRGKRAINDVKQGLRDAGVEAKRKLKMLCDNLKRKVDALRAKIQRSKQCAANCRGTLGENIQCIANCCNSEEEETDMQIGICRKKCGTDNIWSGCVIGCKAKQAACTATCGMNPICITKCVLNEEEEDEIEAQIGICRKKCGTDNIWSGCVIGCKAKQAACTATCGMNPICISKCVLNEEEDFEDFLVSNVRRRRPVCGCTQVWYFSADGFTCSECPQGMVAKSGTCVPATCAQANQVLGSRQDCYRCY